LTTSSEAAAGRDRRPTVSAVIPVLDDLEALRRLLARLKAAAPGCDEVIVVDGETHPGCVELCAEHQCLYIATRAGRGHQMNAGAARASGDALWFLHADAEPPPDAIGLIRRAIRAGCAGGYFRFRFLGPPGWHKYLLAAGINLRTAIGVPYGDQGLFVTRLAFREAGGFPDEPLFEEVPLVRSIRARGRFARLPATIGVSPRRWERDGWLRRSLSNRMLATAYMFGISPGTLAKRYRPIVDKDRA
jgi:rSAM/selenodomain-associated transferase 2